MKTLTFEEWLKVNPAPSFKPLLDQYGSYVDIPEDKWREYYKQVNDWRELLRERDK